ncbi:MAG: bifunctional glutamate N-acetyltransferase/amino-acid acetyltransferase ArgJ [Lentisphaeria bacterium]|nr:bifunctional glutamate N-acetyltransferase/amino-acid acetyltransferase ArgJ [Lentisphaeria bacterium]
MSDYRFIDNGTITSVPGFLASGVTAGFKRSGAPDFAMVYSPGPSEFAGVFTSCLFAAAPVLLCRERVLHSPKLQAVAINSGVANACTGRQGLENSRRSCELVARKLGIAPEAVAVASTGRIGVQLPMELIAKGVELAADALSADGGAAAARAIMTTDTVPKAAAVEVDLPQGKVTIGAMTKGAGMIDPHLAAPHATMICIAATDAKIDKKLLQKMLNSCAADSFDRITVDGDMSTNDTVMVLANGASGVAIAEGTPEAAAFQNALLALLQNLARRMVGDGEGVTKLVTVEVVNARSDADAKVAAEAVANSLLCKTAWYGNDPNWGRVVAALGYSGAKFDPTKCNVFFGPLPVVRDGGDAGTPEADLVEVVKADEFTIRCDFNEGSGSYWVWTGDISHEYVKINADYHT